MDPPEATTATTMKRSLRQFNTRRYWPQAHTLESACCLWTHSGHEEPAFCRVDYTNWWDPCGNVYMFEMDLPAGLIPKIARHFRYDRKNLYTRTYPLT